MPIRVCFFFSWIALVFVFSACSDDAQGPSSGLDQEALDQADAPGIDLADSEISDEVEVDLDEGDAQEELSEDQDATEGVEDALDATTPLPRAMIVATSGEEAIEAGLAVLQEGGNAIDAAITVANTQIVRSGGSWNSFAGIMGCLIYDASSGEVYSLHGNYRTFANENDPNSIPQAPTPSGRTAMTPGYLAAAYAAHQRFGALPFARTFDEAIDIAVQGFEIDTYFASYIQTRKEVLSRRPETQAIFTNEEGEWLVQGDLFKQLALAETLRQFASQGSDYMYQGLWAERFVAAVSEEGGAVTEADLANYQVEWLDPLEGAYKNHSIFSLNERELGSLQIIEALHMIEASPLEALGPWSTSGLAIHWLVRITQVNQVLSWLSDYMPEYAFYITDAFPDISLDHNDRVRPAQAELLVAYIESGAWKTFMQDINLEAKKSHSDAIVVVDQMGNAIALTHTINTTLWGYTGIFVDGVSVPDSASFQQDLLEQTEPGAALPTPLNPVMAFLDGDLVYLSSTIGNVHYAQVQRSYAVLGLGMTPEEAIQAPIFEGTPGQEIAAPGDFSQEILSEALEAGTTVSESTASAYPSWVGITIDEEGGLRGATDPWLGAIGGGVGEL